MSQHEKRKAGDIRVEDNPESNLNKKYLITDHFGGRSHAVYHGNNENIVDTLMLRGTHKRYWNGKRRQGTVRAVRKLWKLECSVREDK